MVESGFGRRVLPYDVAVVPDGPLGGAVSPHDGEPRPPTYDEIAHLIAPAHDPDRWFTPEELAAADWLRSRGVDVLSLDRREGHLLKTPDAVAVTRPITIEAKRAAGNINSMVQRIRYARWQARHVVIDLRGTGSTRTSAEAGLVAALRRYGEHLDEVVLIVSDDLGVGWTHG